MSDSYDDAIRDLFLRMRGANQTNFTTQLLNLIGKADDENLERLRIAFPETVRAWQDWFTSPIEYEFFKSKGLV